MDIGSDVDLSNNNITPLWKPRTDNRKSSLDVSRSKQRPVSYHINGVVTTDVPVADNEGQPAERQAGSAQSAGNNTAVMKHVLQKPSRKTRVVRSISIGHLSSGRFSLSKFRSDNNKSDPLDSKVCNGDSGRGKTSNRQAVLSEKPPMDNRSFTSSPKSLSLPRKQNSSEADPFSCSSNVNNNYEPFSRSSSSSSSPSSHGTLTPSNSSTSSIPSLLSLTSSDPPTPRSPSPADRGFSLVRQSRTSSSSQDALNVSSSSSTSSTSPLPSLSPAVSPCPSIILSTNSPAALKMGTQQLIPKGLVSETRLSKAHPSGTQSQGTARLGLDVPKRGLKTLSMVETGGYFSTGGGQSDEADRGSESPLSRKGLRSTSYRRAVVKAEETEVPPVGSMTHRLSAPAVSGLTLDIPSSPTHPVTLSPSSPGTAFPTSPRSPKSASPKTLKPSSPRVEKSKGKSKKMTLNKKKLLKAQRTFDSEEEELYQNYQEKALHNDSDEDAYPREPKPDNGIVVQYRPIRTSWSQLSVVRKSGLSDQLSPEDRKRQEAIFEVISSEHSYLHSLEILIRMFQNSAELSEAMTKIEHHHLFSNISDVCEASKKFFTELEERHQQSIVIDDISDIVCKHAVSNFDPYVTYCSNEVYQQRTLQKLVGSKNPAFKEVLTRIEGHPDCKSLPMISFLILPMQRITRLPLLMDTICQKTPKDSARYEECKRALQAVSKVVRKCNEGARTMERTEMMYTINSQLEFKIKPFPLVSSSRWMVKRGELTAFGEDSGIFLKRTSRHQVYFFLFNDVLIVTKKKSEDNYSVIDYALRDQIQVSTCEPEELNLSPVKSPTSMLGSRQPGASHVFRLCFRSNHSDVKVPMILGTELLNERARWISALGQNVNNKKTHDRTNVIQVEVIRSYTAKQPDEMSLQVADVVLVSQHVDGWYEGERLRDGEWGWFPGECVERITCQATIERNMQRMDRLQGLETNV
uniref:Rho guanine nucleotide exchange factor (GEF) 26 n=2 Tax=Iconisemion striatum TaxID=60296 RepID=A0A1A7YQV7_9TELE